MGELVKGVIQRCQLFIHLGCKRAELQDTPGQNVMKNGAVGGSENRVPNFFVVQNQFAQNTNLHLNDQPPPANVDVFEGLDPSTLSQHAVDFRHFGYENVHGDDVFEQEKQGAQNRRYSTDFVADVENYVEGQAFAGGEVFVNDVDLENDYPHVVQN